MRLQALHCPSCGAPLDVPPGVSRVSCGFCRCSLVVHDERVSTQRSPPPPRAEGPKEESYPEPDATLFSWEGQRFELSTVEQKMPEAVSEIFAGLELPEERFALVSMRVVNAEGEALAHPLDSAFEALKGSLADDHDPGLAANLALETLCERPFPHALEVAIALFEPKAMRVVPYTAGIGEALLWASSEEGRCVTLTGHHERLERKSLREAREHFANGRPVSLSASDLVLFASAGVLGRGARGYGNGLRAVLDTANEHLGEEPLRVVTLAKNAFWADFQKNRFSRKVPAGDVKLVAVRPILPLAVDALPSGVEVRTFSSKRFEVALATRPGDAVSLHELHDERKVVLWLQSVEGPLPEGAQAKAQGAVLSVLDRKDDGDNENPRQAGRDAYAALGVGPERVRMAVIQLFDRWGRVKYFRGGWKQPIALGDRGVKSDGQQQFDEGGEATVNEGARLLFPGTLEYDGQHGSAEPFAEAWTGGKASRLYEAMRAHWKTKRSAKALEQLGKAARADQPAATLSGFGVVTGVAP